MTYRCEIYCNTGFNAVDIPDSYNTLRANFEPRYVFDDIDLIQTEYLAMIRLSEIEHAVARQVDYIVIEDPSVGAEGMKRSCYTVDHFTYTSADVVEFYLLLDAYNTFGGFDPATSGNEIIFGSANRMCVSVDEDNANFYTLDEPFQPAERCTTEISCLLQLGGMRDTAVEVTAIPPKVIDNVASDKGDWAAGKEECYSTGGYSCEGMNIGPGFIKTKSTEDDYSYSYVRDISPCHRQLVPTNITLSAPGGITTTFNNGTRIWNGERLQSDTFKKKEFEDGVSKEINIKTDLIKSFYDCGEDDCIINYWEVPREYGEIRGGKYSPIGEGKEVGGCDTISNKVIGTSLTVALPSNVSNNKAKYCQSVMVKVYSPVSGEQLDKSVHEICGPNVPTATSLTCSGSICADIRAGGCPVFMWTYLGDTVQSAYLAESIKGGEWRNLTMAIDGSARSADVAQFNYQRAEDMRNQQNELVSNAFTGGSQLLAGLGAIGSGDFGEAGKSFSGLASTIFNGVNSYTTSQNRIDHDQKMFQMKAVSAHTIMQVGSSNFARDLGYNTFFAVVSKYSPNDLISYDTFLTQYGYNVGNKPFHNIDLFNRPAFNYIRVNDIQIRSLSSNIDLVEKVKNQLKLGVRLWHKKPEVQDMMAGGNR